MSISAKTRLITIYRDTYVERVAGESANDRNDRAIRMAVHWYQKHLATNNDIKVILLTNDNGNRNKATSEGISAYTGILF